MNTLIPRETFFGNPDRTSVEISPDGTQLAWLAPSNGVLNVYVAPREKLQEARVITHDDKRGIHFFTWAYTGTHILHVQDKAGDENWRLYGTSLEDNHTRDLTPMEGIQARIQQTSRHHPSIILVALNNRNPQWHDIHRLDITTGEMELVYQNDRFVEILTDEQFELREAFQSNPDGGITIYRRTDTGAGWMEHGNVAAEDAFTTSSLGFDSEGSTLYMIDSRGRNTAALFAVDWNSGARSLLAEDARADIANVIRDPVSRTVQAAASVYERQEWQILDPGIAEHLTVLKNAARGEVQIISRSLDDSYWTVAYERDNGPVSFYLYDTARRLPTFLFTNRAALKDLPLVEMHSKTIKSRDGLDMVIYYSLPADVDADGDGIPDAPLPMVIFPHGGPWARDFWGYDPVHQWLANRGYAVLAVNFRSSTGFGKAFTNAGDNEWGGKILEDQLDAVHWAVEAGIADPDLVAIMGGSFGGYSTLAGLAFHPDVYACGVDIVGPSSLITLLESVPEYWKPMLSLLTNRVGDYNTEEGRALLRKHSPLTAADQIRKPLLIGQGANDPRVKQAESDQIVSAMQEKSIPVTYVLYPDEGHGFARPENRLSFFAVAEHFFARHLGGAVQAIGSDFAGSSITVPAGADEVPGLSDQLG